jgi:hypothetical protein
MSDFVTSPLKERIGRIPTDLVQDPTSSTELLKSAIPEIEIVNFDAAGDNVGIPDYAAIIERSEKERQFRLNTVRELLRELIIKKSSQDSQKLNEVYYRAQAKQLGFEIPLDPGRINGQVYLVPYQPNREEYSNSEEFERAQSDFADALSSQEKYALSGVPFN